MKNFLLFAAETMKEKADKEASCGITSAARSYKAAALKYRQAAERSPENREEYIALAKECEEKAKNLPTAPEPEKKPVLMGHIPSPELKQPKKEKLEKIDEKELEEALSMLNELVGLESVKEKLQQLINTIKFNKKREEFGLCVNGFCYNLIFVGNLGTGKSMLAKYVGKIYHALGILSNGDVVEVDRSNLIAGYVGQTAVKTKEVIDKARGNVLLIDEIYNLANGGYNDFGVEALNALLAGMEDNRDDLVLIVAGYQEPMKKFLQDYFYISAHFFGFFDESSTNLLSFEDYTADEMYQIFGKFCEKYQYVLDPAVIPELKAYFEQIYASDDRNFMNARGVRRVFEDTVAKQCSRISTQQNLTREAMMTLLLEDLALKN